MTQCCDGSVSLDAHGWLPCGRCGSHSCALHAYIDAAGDSRCASCFEVLERPERDTPIRMAGGAPIVADPRAHAVVVFHGLHICGAARHCLELLAILGSAGCHTTMVAPYGGGHWGDLFLQRCNELLLSTQPSAGAEELTDICWRSDRRIVSAHYDPAIAWAARNGSGASFYAHFHTEPEYGLLTVDTLLQAGETATRILFPSVATAASYERLLRSKPVWWDEKVDVLPNAVPLAFEDRPRSSRRKRVDGLRLGIVSRLDGDKLDAALLFETVERLRADDPGLQIQVAGDGLLGPEVRREAVARGLGGCIEFLGWLIDPWPVYEWADVTFLPSTSETMPYAALESARAWTRAVVPRCGHFGEDCSAEDPIVSYVAGDAGAAVDAIHRAARTAAAPDSDVGGYDLARRLTLDVYGLERAAAEATV